MGKQKISYVLIVFCMGVLWNSCTKISKELTTVEFVILNPANGKPFANVPVKINERKRTNKGVQAETIFEGETDVNGRCKFEFQAKKGSGYWYVPYINENYFGLQGVDFSYLARPAINWDPIIKDQYNEARYEITFYAYLKQITKNIHCEGEGDTLTYRAYTPQFVSSAPGGYDYTKIGTGCYEYETSGTDGIQGYARVYMGWHKIEWECKRPSGITFGTDSIWIDAGDYGTMKLLY